MWRSSAKSAFLVALVILACQSRERTTPPKTEPTPAPRPLPHFELASGVTLPSASPPASDSAARFCTEVLKARLETLLAHCSEEEQKTGLFSEQRSLFQSAYEACRHELHADPARVTRDETKAKACLDAIRADVERDPGAHKGVGDYPACESVFSGSQANGAACSVNVECQDGLRCSGGTCQGPGATGADCKPVELMKYLGRHQQCTGDQFCDVDHCSAPARAGGACNGHPMGCEKGLVCRSRRCAAEKPVSAGARCEFFSETDCPGDMFCDRTPNKNTGKCSKKHATGAACQNDVECVGRCSVGMGALTSQSGVTPGQCVTFCGKG